MQSRRQRYAMSSMGNESDSAKNLQRRYYTETASRYDSMHRHEGSTDPWIAKFLQVMIGTLGIQSILDVGMATGRGMRDLKEALPDIFVCGIEPVAALLAQGVTDGMNLPMVCGTGESLPFADASFDAVCEFSILHHAANPAAVIREMMRVAKTAVFICDSNRFGQGSLASRVIKLVLYKTRLWGAYNYLRTGGKRYRITEGDGLSYSYSVYDSFDMLVRWADRVILIPNGGERGTSWLHPLLNSGAVFVCAFKERP
jgi:ubiquinone/menaquinone biosynthesis C-methylase UbiE